MTRYTFLAHSTRRNRSLPINHTTHTPGIRARSLGFGAFPGPGGGRACEPFPIRTYRTPSSSRPDPALSKHAQTHRTDVDGSRDVTAGAMVMEGMTDRQRGGALTEIRGAEGSSTGLSMTWGSNGRSLTGWELLCLLLLLLVDGMSPFYDIRDHDIVYVAFIRYNVIFFSYLPDCIF
eukprot:gb/GECH01005689.1/.p1 GENE.gb/GECH01005689.1/~~gb/GECH01005689.1/.p1  ORF type:complete len:177 (+),score=10.56 gb/GECH01005689.1/:1-531(+)